MVTSPLSYVTKVTPLIFTSDGFFFKPAADLTESIVFTQSVDVQNRGSRLLLQFSGSITTYGSGVRFGLYVDNTKIGTITASPDDFAANDQAEINCSRTFVLDNVNKGRHAVKVTWQHWFVNPTDLEINPDVSNGEHCQVIVFELQK